MVRYLLSNRKRLSSFCGAPAGVLGTLVLSLCLMITSAVYADDSSLTAASVTNKSLIRPGLTLVRRRPEGLFWYTFNPKTGQTTSLGKYGGKSDQFHVGAWVDKDVNTRAIVATESSGSVRLSVEKRLSRFEIGKFARRKKVMIGADVDGSKIADTLVVTRGLSRYSWSICLDPAASRSTSVRRPVVAFGNRKAKAFVFRYSPGQDYLATYLRKGDTKVEIQLRSIKSSRVRSLSFEGIRFSSQPPITIRQPDGTDQLGFIEDTSSRKSGMIPNGQNFSAQDLVQRVFVFNVAGEQVGPPIEFPGGVTIAVVGGDGEGQQLVAVGGQTIYTDQGTVALPFQDLSPVGNSSSGEYQGDGKTIAETPTVVPTAAATRTITALPVAPTYTPLPTYTVYPTYTALPTSAITPTATPTNTPTSYPSENIWGGRSGLTGDDPTDYELGTIFSTKVPGKITHIRVYAVGLESGNHSARIWRNSDNTIISGPFTITYGGFDGWLEYDIPDLDVVADTDYTVSVSTGNQVYPYIANDLGSAGSNGSFLQYPANAGVYSTTLTSRPTSVFTSNNYLRDVVFLPKTPTSYKSCKERLAYRPESASGVYNIDPDGNGELPEMNAYCDMTTSGGGWTLALNYVHKAGTNPALNLRQLSFPLQGSTSLGADESGTTYWGQITPSVLQLLGPTELHLYCSTSAHGRVLNVTTNDVGCLSRMSGAQINHCLGVKSNYSPLSGHSAQLPANATWSLSDASSYTLSNEWFKRENVGSVAMGSNSWSCDNFASSSDDTRHQMWVR